LITEHSDGGVLPEIPGELLMKYFSTKKKEQALGSGDYTHWWTGENLIPNSDGLVAIIQDHWQQERERSDTVSTTLFDKPHTFQCIAPVVDWTAGLTISRLRRAT
jgi:hypothetical protein